MQHIWLVLSKALQNLKKILWCISNWNYSKLLNFTYWHFNLVSMMHTCTLVQSSSLIARFMGPIWGQQDPGGPHVGWPYELCYLGYVLDLLCCSNTKFKLPPWLVSKIFGNLFNIILTLLVFPSNHGSNHLLENSLGNVSLSSSFGLYILTMTNNCISKLILSCTTTSSCHPFFGK